MKKLPFIILIVLFTLVILICLDFGHKERKIEDPDFTLPSLVDQPFEASPANINSFGENGLDQTAY